MEHLHNVSHSEVIRVLWFCIYTNANAFTWNFTIVQLFFMSTVIENHPVGSLSATRPPSVKTVKSDDFGGASKYDPKKGSRSQMILTSLGLAASGLFAVFCIVTAFIIHRRSLPVLPFGIYSERNLRIRLGSSTREFCLLALNLTFVKLSVYSIDKVHHTALKWTLASETDRFGRRRLEFNSNFRFLQSSERWASANGLPANIVMAICLASTYASSSIVFLGVNNDADYNTIVSYLPLLVLGIAILIQVLICIWAICTTDIPTWNQSPFDTAAVQLIKKRITRKPGRCMHGLYDVGTSTTPQKPRKRQMSIWESHAQYRRINLYVWMLIAAGYYWCFIMWAMVASGTQGSYYGKSWSLFPSPENGRMNLGWNGEAPTFGLLWAMGILVGFQGGIVTTAFTCVNLLVALSVDEKLWSKAETENGANPSPSFLYLLVVNWQTLVMYVAEPVFHWIFAIALTLDAELGLQIRYIQILYICLLGTAAVILITCVGRSRPKRSIPTTYGHLQTLVDLIDKWPTSESQILYWGRKPERDEVREENNEVIHLGHAGTSGNPKDVEPLRLDRYRDRCYGGLGCEDKRG